CTILSYSGYNWDGLDSW
nr:immunoglobulin heavy chain junction region [Macaca mulatta]MOY18260.1 immunoglobulin heavy chain junction region [Macaca mulatta]MOY19309.1 immunoglobulin heavy chain junction region [Macaca mulatta]MOY19546.1 immunoglobulin heavy chain junction region [Macaca mulatta]MOY20037.1 immunoglobulin heavy chain junction region [Macaca mulatta]